MESNTKLLLGVVLAILVLIVLLQTWQISVLSNVPSGSAVASANSVDVAQQIASGRMVGGC